ncbi:MAG: glycosyltransferase [Bacteroidales bacterium]|nr:glycosyltransferase [Bacteroidales bacterium]
MKVSIITISYNQEKYIERTILSVLNQTYKDIEYIVVDPGSTDGSRDIIKRYDNRISKIIFEPDNGPADGLSKGFKEATGKIYGFLNSDDILYPDAVQSVVDCFNKYNPDVVYGNGYKIDEDDNIIKKVKVDPYNQFLFLYGLVTFIQPSLFFKKTAFDIVGGFNTSNKYCWDSELFADFGSHNLKIMKINDYLSGFRLYNESISGSQRGIENYLKEKMRIFKKIKGRKYSSFDTILKNILLPVKFFRNPFKYL